MKEYNRKHLRFWYMFFKHDHESRYLFLRNISLFFFLISLIVSIFSENILFLGVAFCFVVISMILSIMIFKAPEMDEIEFLADLYKWTPENKERLKNNLLFLKEQENNNDSNIVNTNVNIPREQLSKDELLKALNEIPDWRTEVDSPEVTSIDEDWLTHGWALVPDSIDNLINNEINNYYAKLKFLVDPLSELRAEFFEQMCDKVLSKIDNDLNKIPNDRL